MTLLTIAQGAAYRLGLPAPASIVSNTEETAQRLLYLANQAGMELMRRHPWSVLTKEVTFTTIAAETQTGVIPADFDRFVGETIWNRTGSRRLMGPLSADEWQTHKATTASPLLDAFRIRGGSLLMIPTPTAGETVAFEYVSEYWVDTDQDGDGDASAWTADDDTSLLDEEMLTQELVWRYRQSAGLDYGETFRTAQITILGRIAADGGRRTIDLGRPRTDARPGIIIPEGSWSLP